MDLFKFVLDFLHLIFVVIVKYFQLMTLAGKPRKDISGQVVVISGAGSGIGRLVAKYLAVDHGARVVCLDVNEDSCRSTVDLINSQSIKVKAVAYKCDISARSEVYAVFDQIKTEVGKVDILINNAGIVSGLNLTDLPDDKIEKTFQVNVIGHFWTIKSVLPAMLAEMEANIIGKLNERQSTTTVGHIVTVASIAGLVGGPRMTDYCASKFAAVGLNEALTAELYKRTQEVQLECGLRPDNTCPIKTTVVCPYFITTGMFDGVVSNLVPALTPVSVADQIVDGILTEADMVAMPAWLVLFTRCFRPFLPDNDVFWRLAKLFRVDTVMDNFTGRK